MLPTGQGGGASHQRGKRHALRAQIKKKPARPLPSFRPKRSGVEKSPPLMARAALRWEISRLRVSSKHFPSAPYRHAAPLEMTVATSSIGHTFGVRVDGTSSRRFLRFVSLTAFQAEGCGGGIAANFIMPPSAVTSISSVIIILTLVHTDFAGWRLTGFAGRGAPL